MKKNVIILVCMLMVFSSVAKAFDGQVSDRKGLFFSVLGLVGAEVWQTKKFSVAGAARVGLGLSDYSLLYVEGYIDNIPKRSDGKISTMDLQLKYQRFITENLYANFGVGTAFTLNQVSDLNLDKMKTGFSFSAGAGYDLRVMERFFVAPEFRYGYRRIGGKTFTAPEVGLQAGWYF